MSHTSFLAASFTALLLIGCSDNPTEPVHDDDHDDELTATLSLSSDHVHTLTELTYTVSVADHHGVAMTNLTEVNVERRAVGSDTWRGTALTLNGAVWEAPYTFSSSGEYELRVSVVREGMTDPEVVYTMPEPLDVVRIHEVIAGMRVEFETFPGHIHEGETATAKFWIMESERNQLGVRPPLQGMHVTMICTEADGSVEEHHAEELEPGVYVADHTFVSVGDFLATIEIGEHDALLGEVSFTTHVVHGH
jgi:hypothetical protein